MADETSTKLKVFEDKEKGAKWVGLVDPRDPESGVQRYELDQAKIALQEGMQPASDQQLTDKIRDLGQNYGVALTEQAARGFLGPLYSALAVGSGATTEEEMQSRERVAGTADSSRRR